MSDMLEQAIIDAEALKQAATKNAETLVLEKYSNQIRGAVESLLEQDDLASALGLGDQGQAADPAAPAAPAPDAAPAAAAAETSSVMEHIPLAATAKDTNEEIEIPLDKLFEEITKLSETMRFGGDEIFDEDLYETNLQEIDEDVFEEDQDYLEEDYFQEDYSLEEDDDYLEEDYSLDEYDDYLEEDFELEEGHSLEEELFEDMDEALQASAQWAPTNRPEEFLEETLTVDVGNHLAKRGWAGLPEGDLRLAEEELLALEQDSKVREERAALRKAVKELDVVNEAVLNKNQKLVRTLNKSTTYMTKLRDVIFVLEEKLGKTNLDNAKLLFQNKALTSDSLNERQKLKLAEAVSNAETIEEAKVIFETLQNTVGSTSRKAQPNSLSEAVQKSSSMILSARESKPGGQKSDPTLDRWKFLAGIDK